MTVDPSRLPTAPTANATAIEPTPTTNVANALAQMMRPRLGTSVNVAQSAALDLDHWLRMPSTAIIGSITESGSRWPQRSSRRPFAVRRSRDDGGRGDDRQDLDG